MPLHPADLALARAAAAGDEGAVDRLTARLICVPRFVRRLAVRLHLPLSAEDVEDLVQDVVTALWRRLRDFRGDATLESWSHRFCELHLRNWRRKPWRARFVAASALDQTPVPAAEQADLDAHLDGAMLLGLLDRLDPDEAAVLRLRHLKDLTLAATAHELGVPEGTVKTWYYRALVKLRGLVGTPTDEPCP